MIRFERTVRLASLLLGLASLATPSRAEDPRFIDNSLLIAPEFPCTWPTHPFPRFQITHQRVIGPGSMTMSEPRRV